MESGHSETCRFDAIKESVIVRNAELAGKPLRSALLCAFETGEGLFADLWPLG
jgi:hypothetical protein